MQTTEQNIISIEGVVDEVVYKNEETAYVVIELDIGSDFVTVTGNLGNVAVGEELCVYGRYTTHPKYGAQFRGEHADRKMPTSALAIRKYLSSGAVKGIGPKLAQSIVDKFGEKTFEIIEKMPGELVSIKGISNDKADEISQEFRRLTGMRSLMIFLSKYDISPAIAVKVWKNWGQFSIEVIKDNPYKLCRNGIDIEFTQIEDVAYRMGFTADDPNRLRAGLYYILRMNAEEGHCCLPLDRFMSGAQKLLKVDKRRIETALNDELEDDDFVIYEKEKREFVYISEYFKAEQFITERLTLMHGSFVDDGNDYSDLIEKEETIKNITYAKEQKKAISTALSKGFLILTGGPGTGKTTTLNAIISLYEKKSMKVMIAAPTGRAAKRISDLTGYDAKTIHRMLEVYYDNSGNTRFRHNERDTIKCDVMIVDEMSMVDMLLFEALLRALKLSCRLIMVGDSDQLPSVGAGNVLGDMIESKRLPVVELKEIFRQAQQSLIVTNAHRIVNGEMPLLDKVDSDFFFMKRHDIASASALVSDLYLRRLPDAYGYDPLDDIQILCPSRKSELGVVEINKMIQSQINPQKKNGAEIKTNTYTFRTGDKVMQRKNNYDIIWTRDTEKGSGIFNGDIGVIVSMNKSDRSAVIDFEGRLAEYTMEMLDELELAYAITVHKSQGSEFNAVILPLLITYDKLYYRNLLYTAVTRAKKMIIIVGSKNAVMTMVNNNRRTLRYSCFRHMLENSVSNTQTETEDEDITITKIVFDDE